MDISYRPSSLTKLRSALTHLEGADAVVLSVYNHSTASGLRHL